MGVCAHEYRYQKRPEEGVGSPGIRVASVISCLVRMLGTELKSFRRTICTLNL